jgi:hypothetical protein
MNISLILYLMGVIIYCYYVRKLAEVKHLVNVAAKMIIPPCAIQNLKIIQDIKN